jgi:hypothetical protein
MVRLFRALVLISTVLFVVIGIMPFLNHLWLTPDQLHVLSYDGAGSLIPAHPMLYWGQLVLWTAISIGLFFFLSVARTAFLVLNVITIVATFFWGFRIIPPEAAGLGGIVQMADGAILMMAYFTSVAERFTGVGPPTSPVSA